jgi:uncharacterized protein YkwD
MAAAGFWSRLRALAQAIPLGRVPSSRGAVPLFHLKFLDGIRRLWCRNFKWAAPVAMLLVLAGCASDAPVEQPSMYFSMAEPGAKLDAQAAATMISLYRKNNGVGAVVIDPELMKIAEGQSQAMASRNKLDHDVKAPLPKRLQAAGYPSTLAVENVSAGYHTLAEAFSGWRDSPPHRANMLQMGVTKMGIAASYAPNTKYKVFWTLILASADKR